MLRNLIDKLRKSGTNLNTGRPEALDGPTLAAALSEKLNGVGGKAVTYIEHNFTSTGAAVVLGASAIPALGVYGTAENPERIRVIKAEIVNVTDGPQATYWRTTNAAGAIVEICVLDAGGTKFANGILVSEGTAPAGGDATITIGLITGINDVGSADDRLCLRLWCI